MRPSSEIRGLNMNNVFGFCCVQHVVLFVTLMLWYHWNQSQWRYNRTYVIYWTIVACHNLQRFSRSNNYENIDQAFIVATILDFIRLRSNLIWKSQYDWKIYQCLYWSDVNECSGYITSFVSLVSDFHEQQWEIKNHHLVKNYIVFT